MKKIFSLLCAAVVALSASALTPVRSTATTQDIFRHTVQARVLSNKADFKSKVVATTATIAVTNITATTADVAINPSDNATYYWDIMDAESYDEIQNGAYAENGFADIAAYFSAYLPYMVQQYIAQGYTATIADLLSSGPDGYSYDGLDPNTEYVVFAMLADATTGACQAPFATYRFSTPDVEPSTNVITMTYNANRGTLSITTTNNDPYFFIFETMDEYNEWQTDLTPASIYDEVDTWIYSTDQYGLTSYFVYSGNQTINVSEFWNTFMSDEPMESGAYIAFAAPYAGLLNGDIAYCQFNYAATALENVEATTASKRLVNGQLIIEKDGVRYNALGTVIK